MFLFVIQNINI